MALLDSLKNLNWSSPWVIGGVVVGGVVLAVVIVPKLRKAGASSGPSAGSSGSPNGSASQQAGVPGGVIILQEEPGGPTTGGNPTPTPTGGPGQCPMFYHWDATTGTCVHDSDVNPIRPIGGGGNPPHDPNPILTPTPPQPPQAPPPAPMQFVNPQPWPGNESTIWGIARAHGVSPSYIESFPENQYIAQRPGGWDRIFTSDKIRVA